MTHFLKRSVTLLELLLASSLVGLLILAISSLATFAKFNLISFDRRAQLQNESSYVLEHIAKYITGQKSVGGAIGDINQPPIDITSGISGDTALKAYIDSDSNGQRDPDTTDKQIAYRYRSPAYQVWFYENYTDFNDTYLVVANKVTDFTPAYSQGDNYLELQITACWDPDESSGNCGSFDNPQVGMRTRVKMPAVSVN